MEPSPYHKICGFDLRFYIIHLQFCNCFKKITKLMKFTLEKHNFLKSSQFLVKKWQYFLKKIVNCENLNLAQPKYIFHFLWIQLNGFLKNNLPSLIPSRLGIKITRFLHDTTTNPLKHHLNLFLTKSIYISNDLQ